MPVSGIPPPISGASASALALGHGYSVISAYPTPTEAVGIVHHLPAATLDHFSLTGTSPTIHIQPAAVNPAVPNLALPFFKPLNPTIFTLTDGKVITCTDNYLFDGTAISIQARAIPGQVQPCGAFAVIQGTRTAHLARFKGRHTALLPQTFVTSTRPPPAVPTAPPSEVSADWIPCEGSQIDPASYPHHTNNFPLSDAIAAICIDSPHLDPMSKSHPIFCHPTPPDWPITPNLIIGHHNNLCAAAQSDDIPPVVQPTPLSPPWKMPTHHPHAAAAAADLALAAPSSVPEPGVLYDAVINLNDDGGEDQDTTLPSYGAVADWLRKIINDKYEEYKRWNGNMIDLADYEDVVEGYEEARAMWSVFILPLNVMVGRKRKRERAMRRERRVVEGRSFALGLGGMGVGRLG
ncbi:hypothetical protein GE09DRAFT_730259 [Coniochaeta sp. 2T2.1]|nr:hypothetical protein GE09DRAFT_730259 [Coniochaeta sp. 2T2.1]